MKLALLNYSRLVQGYDTLGGTALLSGNIVHPETLLQNAEELIGQVTSVSDLMTVMKQLQSNTAYHGLDKLSNVSIFIDTAWGPATKTLELDGTVTVKYSNVAMNAMNAFAVSFANTSLAGTFDSLPANTVLVTDKIKIPITEEKSANVSLAKFISNANSFVTVTVTSPAKSNTGTGGAGGTRPGGSPAGGGSGTGGGGGTGQNIMGQMFGKSSQVMQELMKRLPQTGEKESRQMTQKLNQDQVAQKLMEVAKKTINGGDPLSKDLFS
jgi:hypothetical protein